MVIPEYFERIEDMPRECSYCGASDFRPTRTAQKNRDQYTIFVCHFCKHEVWIKR